MTSAEQLEIKQKAYSDAVRYMDNARETIKKAGREGRLYNDPKYVRTAAGTAYSGVLVALDAWIKLKGVPIPKKREKSIEWYRKSVGGHDKKLLRYLNGAYEALHLAGYYDGSLIVGNLEDGFAIADDIIHRLR